MPHPAAFDIRPDVRPTLHNERMVEIEIVNDDITRVRADAIVNAANTRMRGGGGVDGAIHRVGGPLILKDCIARFPRGLEVGDAGHTAAGDLSADWVIHTVGPNFSAGERNRGLLESCYRRSLAVADRLDAKTVAFPLISAGTYGWPLGDAIAVAIDTIGAVPTRVEHVKVVTPSESTAQSMQKYRQLAIPLRLLEAVVDLHQRGYGSIRAVPSISPSGMYWRLTIATGRVGDGPEAVLPIAKDDHVIYYSNGGYEEFARGIVTGATPLRAVGDLILAELGQGIKLVDDPNYTLWFRRIVERSRQLGQLPWAFDDYGRRAGGWLGDDSVPWSADSASGQDRA